MKKAMFRWLAGLGLLAGALAASATLSVPGVTPNAIVLGQSVVLSGPMAEVGRQYAKGVALAIAETNRKGGIHGRQLDLQTLDDAYDPQRAESNTRQLIEERQVFALFGYAGTGATIAGQALAEKAGVPLIAPLTGSDALRERPAANLFFLRASYGDEMDRIVEHQVTLGITRIALVYQDDPFGRAARRSFEEAMRRQRLAPVAISSVDPQAIDVAPALAEIGRSQPMAIVLGTTGKVSTSLLKGIGQGGQRPSIFGLSVLSPALLHAELKGGVGGIVMSQVVPSPWNTKYGIVRQYRAALAAGANPAEIHHASIEGYIAGRVLIEGLRRAGKELTRAGLVNALGGLRKFDLGDFVVDYGNRRHAGSSLVELTILRHDGSFAN